jgi:uncharacterized protein YbjT (DUF2867 family)
MILVTGAAGKTGKAIISALAKAQANVRALVYRSEQVEKVEACGADEVVIGDMREQDVLFQAVQGIAKIYHIPPNVSPREIEIGKVAIAAALAGSVEQFVYHSVLHPQTEKMPHHWSKLRVEEWILESNLPFSILQPAIYMQNILNVWEEIIETGVYSVPYAVDRELSMVDLDDVAKAAAIVLTEPGHLGATYELCGPKAMSARHIAETLGEKIGRQIKVERTPLDKWIENAKANGLGDYQIETLVKMFKYYDTYGFPGNEIVLRHLLKRAPTDFSAFVDNVISPLKRVDPVQG